MNKGCAQNPVYLYIHDGRIEIRDAASLWGERVYDMQRLIRQELDDEEVQAVCIGPTGAFFWQISPQTNLVTAFVFEVMGSLGFAVFGRDIPVPINNGATREDEVSG